MKTLRFILALGLIFTFGITFGVRAEVLTANKTVTATDGTAYSAETDGIVLTYNVASGNQTGIQSGKLAVVYDFTGSNTNGNRVTINGANTFTGGLTVKNGTVCTATGTALGAADSTITLNQATIMINGADNTGTVSQTVNLSGFGALRASKNYNQTGKITGNGDLAVHCDAGGTLTISNAANDYTGITNIGGYNVSGSANASANVMLGENEVLPNGTVLQIGVTYGTANASTVLTSSNLNMNGKTETVAGLMGVGVLKNNSATASTLNIVTDASSQRYTTLAGANGYVFSGPVNGTGKLTVNVSGDGKQILSGTLTNVALGVADTAVLDIGTRTAAVNLMGLSVADGATLSSGTAGTTLAVNGNVFLGGTLVNIGTINETGTGSIQFAGSTNYAGLTVNVNNGSVILNPTGDAVNGATVNYGENATIDLNGTSPTFAVLPASNFTNSNTTTLSTLTFGNSDAAYTYAKTISLPAGSAGIALVKNGTNTVTLSGNISATSLAVNEGAIAMTSTSNLTFSGAVTGASASSLTFTAGASLKAASLTLTGASQIDLKGANLTLSSVPVAITNTNNDALSVFTFNRNGSNATMNKISGNVRFVLDMGNNANNLNRTYLAGGSVFQGGLEIKTGTLRQDELGSITLPTVTIDGKSYQQLDFNGGSLMTTGGAAHAIADTYVLNMMAGGGAVRGTGGAVTVQALVTGEGAFEIVNDNNVTIANQKNDYKGWTYIGKTSYRSDAPGNGVTMILGNNEVLPDTTVVQIGGGNVYGSLVLDLQGFTETVAGLTGGTSKNATVSTNVVSVVNGVVTSSAGGTLVVNDSANYTYTGSITGNANIRKTGTGTWTLAGAVSTTGTVTAENGTLNYSNGATLANLIATGNTEAGTAGTVNLTGSGTVTNVTVNNGGIVNLGGSKSITTANVNDGGFLNVMTSGNVTTLNMNSGNASLYAGKDISSMAIHAQTGNSTVKILQERYYLQQMFESPDKAKIDSYYQYAGGLTADANKISNMDPWVNKTQALAAATWGDTTTDKSVTNVFQMLVTNTTLEDITLDFGKSFRNDIQLTVSDGETIIGTLDWTNKGGVTNYSQGTLTGVTLEAGKEYTITVRASRFNRTIGCGWSDGVTTYYGLNGQGDYTGLGVRVSGTDTWYAMNVLGSGEWALADSGLYTSGVSDITFAPGTLEVADGASLTLELDGGSTTTIATPVTGTGTLMLSNSNAIPSRALLAADSEGSISVGKNVLLQAANFPTTTITGDLILTTDSKLIVTGNTGRLIVNNLRGDGIISINLDDVIADSADALISLTEEDLEAIDFSDMTLEFTTEGSWRDFLGKAYAIFNGDTLTPEKVGEFMIKGGGWYIWQNPENGNIMFALNENSIPEPSSWCLLLLGTVALVGVRRKLRA